MEDFLEALLEVLKQLASCPICPQCRGLSATALEVVHTASLLNYKTPDNEVDSN